MSTGMEDEIKRWTAKRRSALVMEILQGKTTVAEASRSHALPPSEIETWIDEANHGFFSCIFCCQARTTALLPLATASMMASRAVVSALCVPT